MKGGVLALAAFMLTGCSHAGYRELAAEREGYRPPATALAAPRAEPARRPADDEFGRETARLEKRKKQWDEALRPSGGEPRFLAPAPDLLARLLPAGLDGEAAARALADGYTLETLEALVLLRSPAVASAAKKFRGALEAYSQAANLDEILRQYSAFTAALMPGVGPMAGEESPAMLFPFPGVLALKGEIVTRGVGMAREELEAARRDALTAARTAWWELLYNARAREIAGETLALLGQLEDSARSLYETGRGPIQDAVRAQIEAEKMREELRTMAAEGENLAQTMRRLADLPETAPIGRPAPREPARDLPSIAVLAALAKERRQELRSMRLEIARMELMIEMGETEIFPKFTLGMSFYENRPVVNAGNMRMEEPFATGTTASTGAGLPRNAWYGSGDAYLREARETLASMRLKLADMERETELMVREGWFSLDRSLREEALYRARLSELYGLAAESAARSYETGMMPLSEAVEFTMGRLDAARSAERRRSDAGAARAALERIVGAGLPPSGKP